MPASKDEKSDRQSEHLENLVRMLRENEEELSEDVAKGPLEPPLVAKVSLSLVALSSSALMLVRAVADGVAIELVIFDKSRAALSRTTFAHTTTAGPLARTRGAAER